jgi:hypothetical protein
MNTPSKDRGLLSRLLDDQAYWESLTERLVADAAGTLSEYRQPAKRWWRGLGRVATPMTVGAAVAVLVALLWLPDAAGVPPAADPPPATVYGLAPSDPLAAPFVASPAAPSVATLMATPTSERAP